MATKKTTPSTSTAVAVKKPSGNIVSIQEQLKKQVAELNDRVAPPTGVQIQVTQDKQFKLPDGTKADELELVIVDFVSANKFWEGAFDKDNLGPPGCFAIGTNPKALVPSDNSPVKQSDSCTGCPMNEFNSAGKGKACKNMRILAVLPPDADEKTPLWTLNVSPTALKNFDSYVRAVASAFQMPPVSVVTKVTFDDAVTYASLRFSDPQPNANLELCYARQDEARKLLMTEPDVSQYEATKPAKKTVARGGARRRSTGGEATAEVSSGSCCDGHAFPAHPFRQQGQRRAGSGVLPEPHQPAAIADRRRSARLSRTRGRHTPSTVHR